MKTLLLLLNFCPCLVEPSLRFNRSRHPFHVVLGCSVFYISCGFIKREERACCTNTSDGNFSVVFLQVRGILALPFVKETCLSLIQQAAFNCFSKQMETGEMDGLGGECWWQQKDLPLLLLSSPTTGEVACTAWCGENCESAGIFSTQGLLSWRFSFFSTFPPSWGMPLLFQALLQRQTCKGTLSAANPWLQQGEGDTLICSKQLSVLHKGEGKWKWGTDGCSVWHRGVVNLCWALLLPRWTAGEERGLWGKKRGWGVDEEPTCMRSTAHWSKQRSSKHDDSRSSLKEMFPTDQKVLKCVSGIGSLASEKRLWFNSTPWRNRASSQPLSTSTPKYFQSNRDKVHLSHKEMW